MEGRTLLFDLVTGFLVPGDVEPLVLAPNGAEVVESAIELERLQGELGRGLDELLELAFYLEGRGDSPGAAAELLAAICASPAARAALGPAAQGPRALRAETKRRARRRTPVSDWSVQRAQRSAARR